jgi:acetyl esterase/lipase
MRPLLAVLFALVLASPAAAQTVGGANTGLPGSTCVPNNGGLTYRAPGPDVVPDAFGSAAPAAHEVGTPASAPKGVVITIHGGGWHQVGRELLWTIRESADRWRARGWVTVNVTYRGCGGSLEDVVAFYDLVKERYPALPVCALGGSAGAQLALMLATRRPVDCVAAQAPPSGLANLLTQNASKTYWMAVAAFGLGGLVTASPLLQAPLIKTRVMVTHAATDPLVPLRQSQDLDAAFPYGQYADLVTLDGGSEPFTHANIATESKASLTRREQNLVAPLVGEAPAECDLCGAGAGWSRTQSAAAEVTMSNDVAKGTTRIGTLKARLALTATGGTWTIPATTLQLPAGRHRLQTCWGAAGGLATTFDTCLEKEVTLAAAASAQTPAKTAGFKRLATPYTYYAAIYVKTYVNGAWVGGGGSWHGAHGSRITVPPPGAAI